MRQNFQNTFIALLVLLIIGAQLPASADDSASFERARNYIISVYNCERAYNTTHDGQSYGSYEDLKNIGFIIEGSNYSNMVEDYQFRVYLNEDRSGFTSIVFPDSDDLPIVMIDESQNLCRLIPLGESGNITTQGITEACEIRTDSSPQLDEMEEIYLTFTISDNGDYDEPISVYIKSLDTEYSCIPEYVFYNDYEEGVRALLL
ncbi:MAG: hypothetical protein NTY09_01250 [bacterium]|nr:hypothetical protein [bacterium]